MFHDDVGNRFPGLFPFVDQRDVGTHYVKGIDKAGTCRIHADLRNSQFAAWRYRGRDDEERRGGKIAGNVDRRNGSYTGAQLNHVALDGNICAEGAQQPLGVVA